MGKRGVRFGTLPPPSEPALQSRCPSEGSMLSLAPGDSEVDETPEATPVLPERDATPRPAVADPPLRSAKFNSRDDVGNIGYFFGNWGQRARDREIQRNIDLQIKHNPAHIIGLAECELETENVLTTPAVAGDAQGDRLTRRGGHQYMVVRGNEPISVLIGVRAGFADSIETVHWTRIREGEYRHDRRNFTKAWSRILIVKVRFAHQVGFMGRDQQSWRSISIGFQPKELKAFVLPMIVFGKPSAVSSRSTP